MGYIVVIVLALVVLPLLLFVIFRGGNLRAESGGTKSTVPSQPAADEPTPSNGPVNRISSEAGKKIPPA